MDKEKKTNKLAYLFIVGLILFGTINTISNYN